MSDDSEATKQPSSPVTPRIAQMALAFLNRATLQGEEARAFVQVQLALETVARMGDDNA